MSAFERKADGQSAENQNFMGPLTARRSRYMSRDSAYFVTTFQSIIVVLCKPVVRQYTEPAETRACAGDLEYFSKPCR